MQQQCMGVRRDAAVLGMVCVCVCVCDCVIV